MEKQSTVLAINISGQDPSGFYSELSGLGGGRHQN